jgi:cytochrome c biogenesis protein CcdA
VAALLLLLLVTVATDALNPVLLAAVIYALGSRHPYASAIALLTGYAVSYFAAGIALALGFEAIFDYLRTPRPIDFLNLRTPRPIDFLISSALGVVLLAFAWRTRRSGSSPRRRELRRPPMLGLGRSVLLGVQVNLLGLSFALPYFAAIDQILKADLDTAGALAVLALYNALYVAPFGVLVALRALLGERGDRLLARTNESVDRASAVVMPLLLGGLGALLVADGASYFLLDLPLIPLEW